MLVSCEKEEKTITKSAYSYKGRYYYYFKLIYDNYSNVTLLRRIEEIYRALKSLYRVYFDYFTPHYFSIK